MQLSYTVFEFNVNLSVSLLLQIIISITIGKGEGKIRKAVKAKTRQYFDTNFHRNYNIRHKQQFHGN